MIGTVYEEGSKNDLTCEMRLVKFCCRNFILYKTLQSGWLIEIVSDWIKYES